MDFSAIRNFESPLSASLRVWVCILTIDKTGNFCLNSSGRMNSWVNLPPRQDLRPT